MTSPRPITLIPVRCKTEPNAFRIRLSANSQANPMAGDNWREQFKRVLRSLFSPAIFNLSGFLNRWSFQSRIQILQEAVRSFSKSFHVLSMILRHANEHDRRNGQSAVKE